MALTDSSLAFTVVGADDGTAPAKWLYVVHGIFGAGRNWASVAKRIVRNCPGWGAMLIDLREHGASQGFTGPHTISAAAADLTALAASTGNPPSAILGHSFGGKVSLEFSRTAQSLAQVWVIDSTPDARAAGGSAQAMLEIVQSIPAAFSSREEAVDMLVARGVEKPTAMWMATNLQERGGDYEWRFRLESIAELLQDFFVTDEWDVLEQPRDGVEIHLVKATGSSLLSGDTLERAQNSEDDQHVFIHIVEGGHWLNADNPDAVVQLLTDFLPQP